MSNADDEDPRSNHIKNTVLKLLNIDDSHWKELIWKEENQAIIKDFLETSTSVLLIFLDQNNKLVLSLEMPSLRYIPKIIAYFFKNSTIVSTENYKQEIMFGNVCNLPLSQYQNLFEMVLFPMFSNPLNNKRWPEEIANDIILHFQDFRKTLTYHVGLAEGKTALVIPEMANMIESFNIDEITSEHIEWKLQSVINAITDMLCNWIPIIEEVLGVTSETILLKIQQGPMTEIKFWQDRRKNLEFIQRQLDDSVIKKMVLTLEKTNNYHFSLFKKLLQEVTEALVEADEISNSLSAMSEELQKLEICKFSKLKECLPEAMRTITSSWTSSKYFNRVPSRISILIKKSCFVLIQKVEAFLIPSELFKGSEYEMKEKVKTSIETCNVFLKSYNDCKENYTQDTKVYPWEFPDQRVFDSFENFLGRLNKIYEIFEASALYSSLPDYKILGVQQVPFKMRLDEISRTFKEYYKVFVESTYNPLDLKSDAFLQDYDLFSLEVDELDHKLGTALCQACISCVTTEETFKLMNLIQDLLKRPLVNLEFKKIITSLLRNVYMELLAAKESYDNLLLVLESSNKIIYKNLPSISGELQWSIDLQKKLSFPIESLQQLQHYYINTEDAELILKTYKEMDELLLNFQGEIFSKWNMALDIVAKHLEKPLFVGDENNLILNFSPQILDIAQEIQYVKKIKKKDLLPANVLQFYENLQNILFAYSLLACTVRWYNDLSKTLMDFEIFLIEEDWKKVCDDLKNGLKENWTKNDIQKYSENIYEITKSLYERINQAKENVEEVQKFIETWNKSPVFVRSTPDSLVNFEMFMTPSMRQQIYNVRDAAINMNRVKEENMLLFKSDPGSEEWKSYMLYLDSIIRTGLKDSIKCSLQYLVENTNGENKKLAPFYKVRMILKEDISFIPSLDQSQQGSFYKLLEAVIENIYYPASEIKCLTKSDTDYSGEPLPHDDDRFSEKPIDEISENVSERISSSDKSKLFGSEIEVNSFDSESPLEFEPKENIQKTIAEAQPEEEIQKSSVSSLQLKLPEDFPVPKLQEINDDRFSEKPIDEISENISERISSSDKSKLFGSEIEVNGFDSESSLEFESKEENILAEAQPEEEIQKSSVSPLQSKLPEDSPVPKLQEINEGNIL